MHYYLNTSARSRLTGIKNLQQIGYLLNNVIVITSWMTMLVKTALAAIDFNENRSREVKTDEKGEVRFRMKVSKTNKLLLRIICTIT